MIITMKNISQISIVTTKGDCLLTKDYLNDMPTDCLQWFVKNIHTFHKIGPVNKHKDLYYYHIRRQDLLFVAITRKEMLSTYVMEILANFHGLCKDFCGSVNESSVKVNYVLVNELLMEFMDYGFVQLSSTERLKPYVQSEAIIQRPRDPSIETAASGLFGIEYKTAPSTASNKPVIRSHADQEARRNEIFVDVIERLNVIVGENGVASRCEVQGQINMKSFLSGCPLIKIGFNEDLTVGSDTRLRGYGRSVHLDNISFHGNVSSSEFQQSKIVGIRPPEGEFAAVKYQLRGDLPYGLPIRITTNYQQPQGHSRDVHLDVNLRCDIPSNLHAINVVLTLPVPNDTQGVSKTLSQSDGQSVEFNEGEKLLVWKIKKLPGKVNCQAKFTLIMNNKCETCRRHEFGAIAVTFELSGFVCSNLQIRFLRVFDKEQSYVPTRWIRYVTASQSYLVKLNDT